MGEIQSVWERFRAFKRVLERLGDFWSVWESFGAFGDFSAFWVFRSVWVFWSVWESFQALGRVLEL